MTETPVVVALVQRLGPATGGATQGAQGDVLLVELAPRAATPSPCSAPMDAVDAYLLAAGHPQVAEGSARPSSCSPTRRRP